MTTVFITGANGFIGRALIQHLLNSSTSVIAAVRRFSSFLPEAVKQIEITDFSAVNDWLDTLNRVDVVIHLAARVHMMDDDSSQALVEYRKVNTLGTLNLARQAAAAGVKRFIFISSIKVNGEKTHPEHPFTADDPCAPRDPYGLSKYEAELGLRALTEETGLEVVIIRPPLVYGPGVKANFATLMKWIHRRMPLPFGSLDNKRSLVAIDNLVSFIALCIEHPKAANQIFLISDGRDVSTTELIRITACAMRKKIWLIPFSGKLMLTIASLLGKREIASRLFESLQLDNLKSRELLGWQPVTTLEEQLQKTADAFVNEKAI
ncbi:MAG: UDP-glucose 4-epimerase family protein [Gammaproteobacteria bacterium]